MPTRRAIFAEHAASFARPVDKRRQSWRRTRQTPSSLAAFAGGGGALRPLARARCAAAVGTGAFTSPTHLCASFAGLACFHDSIYGLSIWRTLGMCDNFKQGNLPGEFAVERAISSDAPIDFLKGERSRN